MTTFRVVETIVFALASYFTIGSLTTIAVSTVMALSGRSFFNAERRRWNEDYGLAPPAAFFWAWPVAWVAGTLYLIGRAWMKATERASDAAVAAAERYHNRLRGA